MSEKTLLSGLVDRQRDAVAHTSGPLLILAGAGTGKTTTITAKIAYMVQELGIDPAQILALTFSRAAAANMRARVEKLLNETSEVQVSTFHSFCAGVIRDNADKCGVRPDFSILEDADTAVILHRDQDVGIRDALLYTSSISKAKDLNITIEKLEEFAGQKKLSGNLALFATHQKVRNVLEQADYLSPKYHVVIANPPYMGGKGMNARLRTFLKDNYADVKSDLFSAFIVRNTELTLPKGQLGFMSPFVWMFISSYEKLRLFLIDQKTITSLIQLEYSGFDGATVPICTFTVENSHKPDYRGGYVRLSDFRGADIQGPKAIEIIQSYNKSLQEAQ